MPYTTRDGDLHEDTASDIEFIGFSPSASKTRDIRKSSNNVKCGICSLNLDSFSVHERHLHCEQHFSKPSVCGPELDHLVSPPTKNEPSFGNLSKWNGKVIRKDDVFWFSSQVIDPPSNYTPGLIPLLKKAFRNSHSLGTTRRVVLCYDQTVHVCCALWDRRWGCGYRNFLMACTALMNQPFQPTYAQLLSKPSSPGVCNLQTWIEGAWNEGFDKQGAKELKKLVGTNKWIGTADLWVAFTYRGIPAELVDFDLKNQARGAEIVVDWIVNYFSAQTEYPKPTNVYDALRGASAIVVTERMPLILQHDGHSRIIVGYEVTKSGKVVLLMFDPSTEITQRIRENALSLWSQSSSSQSLRGRSKEDHEKIRKRSEHSSPSASSTRPGVKRARSAVGEMIHVGESEDDIYIIEDPRGPGPRKPLLERSRLYGVDRKLIDKFRLESKKLGKKEYQILYFPMTEPLSDRQRMSSKTVVSTRVC